MKERKDLFDDALAATRAALEEGIVPGGGVALLRSAAAVKALKLKGDEAFGGELVGRVLSMPLRTIAENAGQDGAVVANRVLREEGVNFGYDALTDKYGDLDRRRRRRSRQGRSHQPAERPLRRDAADHHRRPHRRRTRRPDEAGGHDHDHDGGMGGGMGGMGGGMGGDGRHGHGRHGRDDVIGK